MIPVRGYASLPGQFRLNLWTWAYYFPVNAALSLLSFLLFAGVVGLSSATRGNSYQTVAVILWIGFLLAARNLYSLAQKCRLGNINPAVVISINPYLIAVSTDMSRRTGDAWPVIKILHQPLHRMRGPHPQLGDRLPTVALYGGFGRGPHWNNFFPGAVACLTDAPDIVQEAMRRLSINKRGPDHWQRLEQNLARVPVPYKPGLYWMRPK